MSTATSSPFGRNTRLPFWCVGPYTLGIAFPYGPRETMTRKHFVAIAAALAETGASIETVKAVALVLAETNSRFDSDRFILAALSDAS